MFSFADKAEFITVNENDTAGVVNVVERQFEQEAVNIGVFGAEFISSGFVLSEFRGLT